MKNPAHKKQPGLTALTRGDRKELIALIQSIAWTYTPLYPYRLKLERIKAKLEGMK